MSIIVPSGKLTAQVIAELEKFFDKTGPTEEIRWGLFSEDDMKDFGDVRKADCPEVLTEINLQLAKTKAYIGGENPTRKLCPHPDTLKSMLQKKASIRNLADLEYKKEDILNDFSHLDLEKVVAVINWCRRFFTDPTMGVFYPLNADVTVGGKIFPGDSHGSSTTNAGTTRPTPPTPPTPPTIKPPKIVPPTSPQPPKPPSGEGKVVINISGDVAGRSKNGKRTGSGGVNIGSDGVPRDGKGNPIDLD